MAVPKKKTTKSAKGQRRSHHALKKVKFGKCPNCSKPILPHTACAECGQYNKRQVIDIEAKKAKKLKKEKQKKKEQG